MAKDLFYSITVDADLAEYDLSGDISSLAVDEREGQPDHLTVELSDPFKVLGHALREGMDITVDLGTASDHAVVFRGRIYRVDGSFPLDDVPTLKLEAYDSSMKMGLLRRSRVFTNNMTLKQVVQQVAGFYFGSVNTKIVGDVTFTGNGIRQDDETDLRFLLRLARAYGCVAYVSIGATSDTFNFVGQQTVMQSTPAVTLYYGRCDVAHRLLSFHSSADVSDVQLPRVLSGIDQNTGQAISVTTADINALPSEPDPFLDENLTAFRAVAPVKAAQLELLLSTAKGVQSSLQQELGQTTRQPTSTFTTQNDMSAIAQNQFSTSLHGMRASGQALGVPQLVACTSVAIQDVGGRFSKSWYLTQVRHTLNVQGYNTAFECRR